MAGAVIVIEPSRPQELPRQRIELHAARAGRENHAGERDMALEHAGETVLHFSRRGADDHRAGHIGGAVAILPARIDEVNLIDLDRQA